MAKVESIRYIGKEDVYNMEVAEHHNYITKLGTILHNCVDALRYLCIMRYAPSETPVITAVYEEEEEEPYEDFMTGGAISDSYIEY